MIVRRYIATRTDAELQEIAAGPDIRSRSLKREAEEELRRRVLWRTGRHPKAPVAA